MTNEPKLHLDYLITLYQRAEASNVEAAGLCEHWNWVTTIILMKVLLYLQLLDTLPVCQDFNRQGCTRPTCRFVHIREGEHQFQFVIHSLVTPILARQSSQKSFWYLLNLLLINWQKCVRRFRSSIEQSPLPSPCISACSPHFVVSFIA